MAPGKKRHRPPARVGSNGGNADERAAPPAAADSVALASASASGRPTLGEYLSVHRRASDAQSDGDVSVMDLYVSGADIEHPPATAATADIIRGFTGARMAVSASVVLVLLCASSLLRLLEDVLVVHPYGYRNGDPDRTASSSSSGSGGGVGAVGAVKDGLSAGRTYPWTNPSGAAAGADGAAQAEEASRSYSMRQIFAQVSDPETLSPQQQGQGQPGAAAAATATPQSRALDWIALKDPRRLAVDDPHLVQRYVLAVLYFGTNAAASTGWDQRLGSSNRGWRKSMHWLSDLHECDWNDAGGVRSCDDDGYVTDLSLWNNLEGTLSPELGHLSKLKTLYLSRNRLSGTIPTTLGLLTELTYLGLQHNRLTGTVPAHAFGNLRKLRSFHFEKNDLTGVVRFVEPLCQLMVDATPPKGKTYLGGSLRTMTADCRQLVPWKEPEITCACCTKCYRA